MKKIYVAVCLVFLLTISSQIHAQISKGKNFWFGFMQNYPGGSTDYRVYISAETATTGVISSPLQGWSMPFTVTPGVSTAITVPVGVAENADLDNISSKALHIETDNCVSVFAHNYQSQTSDAEVIFPINSLGSDYFIFSWTDANNSNNIANPELLITACENGTQVSIKPSVPAQGHPAGVAYSITLDSGQVYQLQSSHTGGDLTGTRVTGLNNKNFAVFGGHVCAVILCTACDHICEQMYPINTWGLEYITVPLMTRSFDVYRIMAANNGTQYSINGGAPVTLNSGQFSEVNLSAVSRITSTQPITVAQYSIGVCCNPGNNNCNAFPLANPNGDPFMIVLSPTSQSINQVTFNALPSTNALTYYINVVAKTSDLSTLTLDGAAIGGNFTLVNQNPTFSSLQMVISGGDHTLKASAGMQAYVYAYGNFESFGYSAGVRVQIPFLSIYDSTKAYCPHDTVQISLNSPDTAKLIYTEWDLGDGSPRLKDTLHFWHVYDHYGKYPVTLIYELQSACIKDTIVIDTIKVLGPEPYLGGPFNFCVPTAVDLKPAVKVVPDTLFWSTSDTSFFTTDTGYVYHVNATRDTVVYLRVSSAICDGYDTARIFVAHDTAGFTVTNACDSKPLSFANTSQTFAGSNYLWLWDYGDGTTSSAPVAPHSYSTGGTYNVKLRLTSPGGCSDSIIHPVTIYGQPHADFTANRVCKDSVFTPINNSTISSGTFTSTWYFGDGTAPVIGQNPSHTYAQSGGYNIKLVTAAPGCADSLTLPNNIIIGEKIDFVGVKVCLGDPSTFTDASVNTSGSAALQYNWNFGDGSIDSGQTVTHTYANAGTYNVTLALIYSADCADSITKPYSINPQPTADFTVTDLCNTGNLLPVNNSTVSTGALSYQWTFGDSANVVTGQNPSHNYALSGNYNIQLVAVSDSGCTDTVVKPLRVIKGTHIDFNSLPVCYGQVTTFTDQTTNPYQTTINGYLWDFGDSTGANTQNPTHTYISYGTRNVKLRLDYGNNCADSLSKPVLVNQQPVAAFTVSDICNDSVLVPNNTTTGAATYSWNFADGSAPDISANPSHTFHSSGIYTVALATASSAGCTDTTTANVIVVIGTQIDFAAPAVCDGSQMNFTDQTANPYVTTINGYTWSFGDGTSASAQNTTHTYATFGTYNVQLKLDYNNNCADSFTKQVTIDQQPTAAFTVNDICNDSTLTPNNTSTGATTYSWNFADGSIPDVAANPSHTFHTSGIYTVALATASSAGCTDTTTANVVIVIGTKIDFAAPAVCDGSQMNFTDQTTNPYVTTINGFTWSFGDGANANTQNATHTYATFGTYNVQLKLDYNNNCADSITKTVSADQIPTAAFAASDICNDSVLAPNNNSTGATNYSWNFADGSTIDTTANPMHTYSTSGVYTLMLAAISSAGCSDTATNNVTVVIGTKIDFSAPAVCNGMQMNFNDQTGNPYVTTINGYTWSFGDGTNSNQQNATHTYAGPGIYTTQLKIDYNNNCSDSLSKQDTVNQNPVANFTATTPCDGTAMVFADSSSPTASLVSFNWAFGDGITGTGQNPAHLYNAAGSYNVTHTAITDAGCLDSITKPVTVLGIGNATFTAPVVCYPNSTQFTNTTDTTIYPVASFAWNFGDGPGASVINDPLYTYGTSGTYSVTLIAYFVNGCADTTSGNAEVAPIPTITSTIKNVSCFGGADGEIELTPAIGQLPFTYNWNNTSVNSNTNAGLTKGDYTVTFTDANTCSSSAAFIIAEPPAIALEWSSTPISCYDYSDGTITITALGGTPGYTYLWSNGEQTSAISQLGAGDYSITVTDSLTCSASAGIALENPPPFTVLLPQADTLKLGETLKLSPTYMNGNAVSWTWTPDNYLSCATCQVTEANPYYNTLYVVEAVTDKGCRDTAQIFVWVNNDRVVFVPNVFSPNGDGSNDYFEVFGNKEGWKQFNVEVFDRIGEKVFESNDMNFKWDGAYKGKAMSPAVFVYVIKLVYLDNFTEKVYKGSLTLLR